MPFGKSDGGICLECGIEFQHLKKLSEHIKKSHNLSSIDYVIKHMYNSVKPVCIECGKDTRYVSISKGFKKYCIEHAKIAESIGGKLGASLVTPWNKGITKNDDKRIEEFSKSFLGEGNPFFGKHHTNETIDKISAKKRTNFEKIIETVNNVNATLISEYSEFTNKNSLLTIQCNNCGLKDSVSFFNISRCWRCKNCNPIGSKQQLEIASFIKILTTEEIITSTRNVISPFELDIWVPSKNLAIEYHGLFWHSGGKDGIIEKSRHKQKYELCRKNNIKLIQFFSDEWINKKDICKSMIRNAMKCNDNKIDARHCVIKHLSTNECKQFLDSNHISGYTNCKHKIGLFHPVLGLVGIATTRLPIQKKWGKVLELARMCFLCNCTVRGGASKLLKELKLIAKNENYDGILSYAELRYGDGLVYEKCGFELIGETSINYWYTDGIKRHNRFKFRAKNGKSEKQVAEECNVRPIYGVGNKIYLHKL